LPRSPAKQWRSDTRRWHGKQTALFRDHIGHNAYCYAQKVST
jgi:hypothetical protein